MTKPEQSRLFETYLKPLNLPDNPYYDFTYRHDVESWYDDPGARRPIFKALIDKYQPHIIFEVGSFVGESAVHMGTMLRNLEDHSFIILCIDTFLGGVDHWLKVPEKLKPLCGRPSLYEQFLINIMNARLSKHVLPLCLDSANAARYLAAKNLTADMIYIDASHEKGDVLRDYRLYWKLLRPGGVFLVDDLTNHFPGVLDDFKTFCEENNLTPTVECEKGVVIKP